LRTHANQDPRMRLIAVIAGTFATLILVLPH
jgi:hypothetical protein